MTESEKSQSHHPNRKQIIMPSFYVDNEGRVICESHSQIERIRAYSSLTNFNDFNEAHQVEKLLTCKMCTHYTKDECYFPKEEIDKIERDRLSFTFHCKLCGGAIDRPLTIMYSLYNKSKLNVDIPLVCCSCFSTLDDDTFLSNSRRRIALFSVTLLISIVLFVAYSMVIMSSSIWGIFLLVVSLVFWVYMAIRDIRNIIFLIRGRKYYKKTYGKIKEKKEGEYIPEFPFD